MFQRNITHNSYRRRKKKKNRAFEVFTLLVCILLVCCAYAGKIDPADFFLAPFMTLAFMPMLLLTLALVVIALVFRRWWSLPLVAVALIASLPIIKLFSPMNTSENALPVPADPRLVLKVMTYNVLSFNYNDPEFGEQPSKTMALILEADPDVVLMQEGSANGVDWSRMPSLEPYQKQIQERYPYRYYSIEGLNIMSKYPFTTQPLCDPQETRSPLGHTRNQTSYLARAYDLQLPQGKQLRLVDFRFQSYHLHFGKSMNARVSPDVKPAPLERMRRSFALRTGDAAAVRKALDDSPANLIVCGDMNDVPSSHVYRVLRGQDLKDAWADSGRGYAYTYNRHSLRYRIDQVFYRGDVRALHAERLVGGSSDHYPLVVSFDIDNTR